MPGFSHKNVVEPNVVVEQDSQADETLGRQGLGRYNLRRNPKQKILIIASATARK
ncbi:unnamed protein product [Meloidogyne enterolobii]|uniref:Uncharacterized protein n=1 Tax=Meloidogyne enterolobii TaxID=390850 RepID=A0ACB1B8G8_MELEN